MKKLSQKKETESKPIEIMKLEEIERKYNFMLIELYTYLENVSPSLQDELNLDMYIIDFSKAFKSYIKLKKYHHGSF